MFFLTFHTTQFTAPLWPLSVWFMDRARVRVRLRFRVRFRVKFRVRVRFRVRFRATVRVRVRFRVRFRVKFRVRVRFRVRFRATVRVRVKLRFRVRFGVEVRVTFKRLVHGQALGTFGFCRHRFQFEDLRFFCDWLKRYIQTYTYKHIYIYTHIIYKHICQRM